MAIDPSAVWDFAKEVIGAARPDRGRTLATVTRIDADGTTWVTTGDGGEAPAGSSAAGVSVGDTVTLEWDGAAMGIRGNVSNPSPAGSVVRRAVARAQGVADAAQRVADAVNQHFFADTSGIHVTEATQEEWETSHSGANVLINSVGQLFRDGLNNLLTLTTENGARALTIWDGLGNAAENIRAVIGAVIQLGKADESHVELDYHSMQMLNKEGKTYFHASDLRDRSGKNTYTVDLVPINAGGAAAAGELTIVGAVYDVNDFAGECTVLFDGEPYTGTVEPIYDDPNGYFAGVFGWRPIVGVTVGESVTGQYDRWTMLVEAESPFEIAFTFGERNPDTITAGGSSVFGSYCEASGFGSFATGIITKAIGAFSRADGIASTSRGLCAEASGRESTATGDYSHAEGMVSRATGDASHAEGMNTKASGDYSHAQNSDTIAASDNQTAIGRYNEEDANGTYALIIGNGVAEGARHNAHTVDWGGNAWYAGTISAARTEGTVTVNTGNVTIDDGGNYVWSNGVACSFLVLCHVKSALANGSELAVGTIPEGYRPPHGMAVEVYASTAARVTAKVDTAGKVTIKNISGSSLATTTYLRISGTWAL